MNAIIQKLRNRKPVDFYNSDKKFMKIQINKKTNNICWQRFVSSDKKNWIEQNSYLNLKEVMQVISDFIAK